jgi:hypothetical protein
VVARSDGAASGGHLLEGRVRPTLEVVLSESPAHLRKRYDRESGLALIALDDGEPAPVAADPQGEASLPRVPSGAGNLVGEQAQRLIEGEEAPRSATEEGA